MDSEARYAQRSALIEKAINLEQIERIPVLYQGSAFAPRYMGVSLARYCRDPDAAVDVTLAAMERLGQVDGVNIAPSGRIAVALSRQWLSRVLVPGRDLPEDSLWQVVEAEMMTVDDYDLIIDKGWKAFLSVYMPRVLDQEEARQNTAWLAANWTGIVAKFRSRGFVILSAGSTTIPLELFCGGRSMHRFFLDLFRMPDKVKAAMDVVLPDLIQTGVQIARLSGVPRVWIGGWRAASELVSPRLWERFVLPYYHAMVTALAENGITSILHFDQDWTRDLARLRELPPRKCVLNLDGMTDIRKAKEVLGDHMALAGDVPSALFATGTPDDVYTYVRDLARDVGPTGLILCPGCDAPVNTRPENMEAFVAAAAEFGGRA